jgi:hypothetical protein
VQRLEHYATQALLQMSEVVNVIPLNVFMVYTGTILAFTTVWRNDFSICVGVILSYRK